MSDLFKKQPYHKLKEFDVSKMTEDEKSKLLYKMINKKGFINFSTAQQNNKEYYLFWYDTR